MAKGEILVGVKLDGVPEVAAAMDTFRKSLVNRVMKSGATKGARRTLPPVKGNLDKHKRTGQLRRAEGVKFAGYRGGWTVLLGARKYFRGSFPGMMSPNATTVDPVKYAHLLEGGRSRPVYPGKRRPAKALPIFVRKLDVKKRKRTGFLGHGTMPRGKARRMPSSIGTQYGYKRKGKTIQDRARRVPGGWLLFSMSAMPSLPRPWLSKEAGTYGRNIKSAVTSEVVSELPRLAAVARSQGRNPYK